MSERVPLRPPPPPPGPDKDIWLRVTTDPRPKWYLYWQHLGGLVYNQVVTYIPSQWLRRSTLRLFGATWGRNSNILRGTTVLYPGGLSVGDECSIGFRCVLDARGSLTIGNRVVIASDSQLLMGEHDYTAPMFDTILRRTVVEDYVWITTRVTVEGGVRVGRGAVLLTCALVRDNVEPLQVMAGVPARVVAVRPDTMAYNPAWRPWGM